MYTEIPQNVLEFVRDAGQSDEAISFDSDVVQIARKHFNRNRFVGGCYSRLYDAIGVVSFVSLIGGLFQIKFFKNYSRWKVVALSVAGLFFFRHMSEVSMRLAMRASCRKKGEETIKEISKGAAWKVPFYFPVRADWTTEVMYQVGIPLIKGSAFSVFDHAKNDPETIIY